MTTILAKISDRLIHWVIVFSIIAVPAFYVYGKGDNYFFSIYDIYKEVLVQSIAIILLGLFSFKTFFTKDASLRKSKVFIPIAFYFLMLLISFTQMINPYEGFIFLKRWMSYFIIFFVVVNQCRSKEETYLYINWFLLIGTLFAGYGVLQIVGYDFSFLVQNFKGNATDGNPNFAGQYVCMILPFAFWMMIGSVGQKRSYLFLMATIITGIFILLNRTKGAWIGLAFSFSASSLYLFFSILTKRFSFQVTDREKELFKGVFKMGAVFLLIFIAFSLISFIPSVHTSNKLMREYYSKIRGVIYEFSEFESAAKMFRHQDNIPLEDIHVGDTTMQRIIIWQNTCRLIKANPFFGVGLGNYKIAYQPYRTKKEQLATGPDVFVRRTHNEYLQLTSELGPVGIFFFFLIQFMFYQMGDELIRRTRSFQEQCTIFGFVCAFMAIFVTAAFGFALQNPNPSFTLWTLGAIFAAFHWFLWFEDDLRLNEVSSSYPKTLLPVVKGVRAIGRVFFFVKNPTDQGFLSITPSTKKIVSPLLLFFFVFSIIGHYWLWKPATAFYNRQFGQALQRMGLHEKAAIVFRRSLELEPLAWETRFLLANEYAAMNQFEEAVEEHEFSLKLNPYHAKGHYNLGNTYHKMAMDDKAMEHYEKAVKYDYMLYQGFTNLGAMYFKKRQYEKSIESYKRSLEINPNFFSAHYNVAYALCGLGRIGEAIPYLKRAKELQPKNEKVLALEKRVAEIIQQAQRQQKIQVQPK